MGKNLHKSLIISENNGVAIYSSYPQGDLSDEKWNLGVKLLKGAYPELRNDEDFFTALKNRVKARKFSDEKFSDAVKNAIDTVKILRISDIISYDKTFKVAR